jgi:hypothetical protein
MGFVLYGGTAIALRLGHRQSVDFDFFTERSFDHQKLAQRLPFLKQAMVLQEDQDTLTYSIEAPVPGQIPVKVSFFTVGTGRVWAPEWTEDGVMLVASMQDLLAHKLKVLLQRLETKDYLDVHALISNGFRLEDGLAAARAMYGRTFQPAQALKSLTWFQGGDLHELPAKVQKDLIAAVTKVQDLPPIPDSHPGLGGGAE